MQTDTLYATDEMLAARQRTIALCTAARASAIVAMSASKSGMADIVSGRDRQLHDAIADVQARYVFEMHGLSWEAFPSAEIADVDCLGTVRQEDVSPYKSYYVVKMYAGCDLHGDVITAPEILTGRAHEILAEKMYLTELLSIMEQIAQDDTVSYHVVRQQLADIEAELATLHIEAINYARAQGFVRETIRPRWKGGRIVICRK